jgi:hypothetical protein
MDRSIPEREQSLHDIGLALFLPVKNLFLKLFNMQFKFSAANMVVPVSIPRNAFWKKIPADAPWELIRINKINVFRE